jgi:hypothetical protein
MRRLVGVLVVLGTVLAARPACAQISQPTRPYRGLFGSGVGNTDQSLTFMMSLSGGYDTSVQAALPTLPDTATSTGALPPETQAVHTAFEQASAGFSYSLSRPRVTLTASANAGGTYYQTLSNTVTSYGGTVGGSFAFTPRTGLSASEAVTYEPLFFSSAFPALGGQGGGQPVLPITTSGVRLDDYVSQSGTVDFTHKLSSRVDVSFGYGRTENTFGSDDGFVAQSVFARLNVGLTRHLSVWASDTYFDSEALPTSTVAPQRGQYANFGLSYNRLSALSLTRRLTLSLGAGATVISDGKNQSLAGTGNATLKYDIGRTWNASVGYARTVGFVEFFQEPVTTDGVVATFGGLISRRLTFQSSAGALRGDVAFTGPSNGFQTDYGIASLSCALTRNLSLALGYSDYRYKFDAGLQLPAGVLSHTDGQSVYVSLSVWEPLFMRSRRGDVAR